MGFDLNQFTQKFSFGGARATKFDVQLTLPPALAGIDPTATNKLLFTCRAASVPAFHTGTIQVPYFGRKIKVMGDRTWNDWNINIMLDEDYTTRALFEAWSNAMNRLESNVMANEFQGELYKTTMMVTHYSKVGTTLPIRQYQLIGAWPSNIGEMRFDWDRVDSIVEFGVTIAFDNLIPTIEQTAISSSTEYAGEVDQDN